MKGAAYPIWSYVFLAAEIIMCIGLWIGHISRSFPVQREKVYMDDLVEADPQTGDLKVAVLLPTAGEKLNVLLYALFGNLQLRLWKTPRDRRETLRVIVLDEKRREQVMLL
jgi:hypothetical protein